METERKAKKTLKGLIEYSFSKILCGKSICNQLEANRETGNMKVISTIELTFVE